jgi:thymidylate kinase
MTATERKRTSPAAGRFLTLDGPDGGGKTTQAAVLAAWLCARGGYVQEGLPMVSVRRMVAVICAKRPTSPTNVDIQNDPF